MKSPRSGRFQETVTPCAAAFLAALFLAVTEGETGMQYSCDTVRDAFQDREDKGAQGHVQLRLPPCLHTQVPVWGKLAGAEAIRVGKGTPSASPAALYSGMVLPWRSVPAVDLCSPGPRQGLLRGKSREASKNLPITCSYLTKATD